MINTIKDKYNAAAVFPYGSAVYKNKKPEDHDFIIISDKDNFQESFILNEIKIEVTNYSNEDFKRLFNIK